MSPLLLQCTGFSEPKSVKFISTTPCRLFRIMDDDGSKSLDLTEFKKGLHDYGLTIGDKVSCVRHINLSKRQTIVKNGLFLTGRKNMPSDHQISYILDLDNNPHINHKQAVRL